MSLPDIATEFNRVRRIRNLLEPLAVFYEKTVLEAGGEPFELRLTARQLTSYARESAPAFGPVHSIDGESLKATHEVWQEYRRIERELMERSRPASSDRMDADHTLEIPILKQTDLDANQENLNRGELLPVGLDSMSDPERTWLKWFYVLSEDDKTFVESCGENDISVTPENFDQMKKSHA